MKIYAKVHTRQGEVDQYRLAKVQRDEGGKNRSSQYQPQNRSYMVKRPKKSFAKATR